MSVWSAVGFSLLLAFGLPLAVFLMVYPIGKMFSLWQAVSLEERARHQLVTPNGAAIFRPLVMTLALLQMFRKPILDFLAQYGIILPLNDAHLAISQLVFVGLLYLAPLFYLLLWSWRVLRQPAGVCSAPLRRVALAAFPLSILVFGLIGLVARQLAF